MGDSGLYNKENIEPCHSICVFIYLSFAYANSWGVDAR